MKISSQRREQARGVQAVADFAVKTEILVLMIPLFVGPMLRAQQTVDELRDLARNPVGDAIKVPFVENINFGAGPYDRTSNSLQIQPVIPWHISQNWLLVPRIVATAVAYEPDVAQTHGGTTGSGDTVATFFFAPFHAGKLIWAVGPSLLIPTATARKLGTGKWDMGPSAALLVEPDWGFAGVVVQNIWSLPGHSSRATVNQIQIETSLSYNLPHGWYLVTAPTINADWRQATGQRWLVPFGGGAGRTFNIRNQAVDSNVALYYNAIRPASRLFPRWQLSLQLTLIYPKEHKPTPKNRQGSCADDPQVETN
ncbi:MAG: hypothetical protein ABSC64_02590 [Candidatus Korobacteraceae bacterium]|jgi:hypothetical protein